MLRGRARRFRHRGGTHLAETRIFNDPPRVGRVKETEQGAENRVNTLYNESAPLSCLWDRVLQESRQRPPVCVLHGNDSGRNRRIDAANFERKLARSSATFRRCEGVYIYIIILQCLSRERIRWKGETSRLDRLSR